ncbi:MAG TPA: hypothetical protein VI636_13765 [Candidatus Angelobacter sp.]
MDFIPGDVVPMSGVYCVEHSSHRLMHEAALLTDTRFPRCKHCKDEVRFQLVRPIVNGQVLPFHVHAFLEEYTDPGRPLAAGM